MAVDWEHGDLAEGLACYRRQQFFETHEYWERIWLGAAEPEKTFLQALIQVAVAFHHLQRGNAIGSRRMLTRAHGKLGGYPAEFCGVNVSQLSESIVAWLRALEANEEVEAIPFPVIR